jgi:hypothetical protein
MCKNADKVKGLPLLMINDKKYKRATQQATP